MKDVRQSAEYANYMQLSGWKVEKIDGVYSFIKKIPVLGNFIKIQRPKKINEKIIKTLEQKYYPFEIVVEPLLPIHYSLLPNLGFKPSKSPYLPSKTLQLDLTKSKEKLFNQLKKDCKYALRKSANIKIKNEHDPIKFYRFWKKAVNWKRYVLSIKDLINLKKSFRGNALYLIEEEGNAGAIFLMGNKTAYYWQAFTNKEGRKNYSQYQIVWQGILWAKKSGAKIFDFEGVYDERFPNKKWLGFTHFKKSFGGQIIEYPEAFKKTSLPALSRFLL